MARQRSEAVAAAMSKSHNIRNMCVIAHVDHGKSTLTDALVYKAGIITEQQAGQRRFTDSLEAEQEKGITIKSSSVSMYYELDDQILGDLKRDDNGFLVNLIDSPGHVDFSSEVTAALRVTDGALLVVDAVSGVSVQTETVLRQALSERVQLTLVINKVDRCILEQKLEAEELYQKLSGIVARCNALIATYRSTDDSTYSDEHFNPILGNVAFASGKQGWAFTLNQFATFIAEKAKVSKDKYLNRLWGESYYSSENKKWVSYEQSRTIDDAKRGFNQFILQPLYQILNACAELNMDEVQKLLSKIDVKLSADKLDASVLDAKKITANVMKRWLPAGEAMLHLIVLHLPSPVQAQVYRIKHLYEGPQDDQAACSMKACDPNGEVMIYISKKIPAQDGSRFLCFGRIFSGTVVSGTNVRVLGPDYRPGSTSDLQIKNITSVGVMVGDRCMPMNSVPAGNVVALSGIDKCLVKTATITTSPDAHNFRVMKFSVSPVVRVAVDAKDPTDHAKLVEGLKKLVQADSLVQVLNENGQHVIAAAGELHLEICLADLEKTHARCPLKVATPIVTYRETITAESRQIAFTKTTNKHNKFFMRASPLEPGLAEAIESGRISSKQDPKERSKILVEEFGWDLAATKKIWAFGPYDNGPNMLVDGTRSVDGLGTIQDAVVAAFQWTSQEGVLASENLRGARIELLDAEIHRDAAHRRPDQLIPAIRRCLLASLHMAAPRLLEPIFLVDIECPTRMIGRVYATLNKRRGQISEEEELSGTTLSRVKAFLPVNESFGFTEELRHSTGGTAFPQCQFDHWALLPGEPFELNTKCGLIVTETRQRKNLPEQIPALESLIDRQ
ncbi:unnamed protein product [Rotaria socialis]|uniref:Tr-type G domain-containing protein n=1 Tax=Rotaria socialis TaxID=392032 RepID=A0A817Y8N0_9BILA|nr:unnamed protein product [Rotaria socialis]CAF3377935.1 unnamed protein product [Rotaria socialis]CAF3378438.1 unnamed protein product [Rotaria socialis]CAF3568385.1 unnamed protein product [Rotaria socialis]CAF3574542.1 unnamed protein product [Rotaria socialis]